MFKNFDFSYLVLILNLGNPTWRMTILHAKNQFQVARNDDWCTVKLIWIYCSVVKVSSSESGHMGSILVGCWNPLSAAIRPFCMALSQSVHWYTRFYVAAFSIIFLLFHQWPSRAQADRVLTLDMNIRLPLFWSDRSWARCADSAICAGLAHGRDFSECRVSEQKSQRCLAWLAIGFPWTVKNTWK